MDNYNFLTEQSNLGSILKNKKLDENFFTTCLLEYDNKRRLINENVDSNFFQVYMREKYGYSLDNIGFKKDTSINKSMLKEIFDKKYPFSLNLDIDEFEIIKFCEHFLKDEKMKTHFYDKKNDSIQYKKALEFIVEEQSKYEEKKQVTFYSLFPQENNC